MTIKEIRASTGLSQRKFCDALGIPCRTLEQWEVGDRCPPPYLVELIAYRVRTDPDFPRKTPNGGETE
jgi:DNA-binding transcriptional regulator YiaG